MTKRYLAAVLGALAVLNIAALVVGTAPLELYRQLFATSFGSWFGLSQVAFKATPLIFLGTAAAVAFSAGTFNIGGEGQAIIGGLAAAMMGWWMPGLGIIPLIVIAAIAAASFSLIAGGLRERWKAPEVMTTILLNFLAAALANYVVAKVAPSETSHTPELPATLRFTSLAEAGIVPGAQLTVWFIAAVLIALAVDHWLFKSRLGYAVRALGSNEVAARLFGTASRSTVILVFALSGALAGMAGVHFVIGNKGYYEDGMTGGIGFVGIAVALLASQRPRYVIIAALTIGVLQHSSLALSTLVPKEITDVVIAVLLIGLLWARHGRQVTA